jgi:hypothetical protein
MKRKAIILIGGIILSLVMTYLSFIFGGPPGLLIWLCFLAIVALEVLYHYGAALFGSSRSRVRSEAPDPKIEASIRSPRGWYDLDYRGRGKN